ncbi:MAG: glycoside hydrolase family 44 protein [Caldilineaceae bacterium]
MTKYGPQQAVDPWRTDCGNGLDANGDPLTGNDPGDTSIAIGPAFVESWMHHLIGQFGSADSGGVAYYSLDNEPMLWHETHRDVHPEPVSYDELWERSQRYAETIKRTDPSAQIVGPALWGWTAYSYSALDQAAGSRWWNEAPDRNAHGGMALVPWYLAQMQHYETTTGTRLLDYLDLHYYPQSGVALTSAGNADTQALRLRSTRSLWDPSYRDESWIGESVKLIPRMRAWVDENYPGTKLAITEYNWGGLENINGALAQADVLGIFGREGLDMAMLWDPLGADAPFAYAFRLYRNYDGAGGQFGDRSLTATSSDEESVAVYAARRSADQAVTVMIVNKHNSTFYTPVQLTGIGNAGSVQRYRYSVDDLNAIVRLPDQRLDGNGTTAQLDMVLPGASITLLVINPTE